MPSALDAHTADTQESAQSAALTPAQTRTIEQPRRLRLAPEPRVSVIIPALNEAENLPHVFAELPEGLHEVILVDGLSTDGTVEVARALRPDVLIVEQEQPGKGEALRCGFQAASGDVIVMLDADGSADPAELPIYLGALLAGADFAKGSRFISGGGSADITATRRLGNRLFSSSVNLLFGTRYSDLCYGYNAFWRHCLPSISVDCHGFEIETLINIRIARARLKVAEVPSFERERIHGESNLRTFRDGSRVLATILRERLRHKPAGPLPAREHQLGVMPSLPSLAGTLEGAPAQGPAQ